MGRGRIIIRPTPMIQKQIGQMKKLLGFWDKRRASITNNPVKNSITSHPIPTIGSPDFLLQDRGLTARFTTRRQIVLNRHFTEIISDVLVSNFRTELTQMGVNITSIETKAWNKGVKIFYSTKKTFDWADHEKLNSFVPKLRMAITERQLIGRTPTVTFVYDQTAHRDQEVGTAFERIPEMKQEEANQLVETPSNQLKESNWNQKHSSGPTGAKAFSAPSEMCNMMLGIDYQALYNEAANKSERGRAISARMPSNVALAAKPLFRAPIEEETDVNDPATRYMKMQRFIINQRKKSEYMAKIRRRDELIARDNYKWDLPSEEPPNEPQEDVYESFQPD